jgi:hypothetical protein
MVLSTFYAATASDLIADINAANTAGGANTIVLTAPTSSPYVLTAVNNRTDAANVLPVIAAGDNLTILTSNGNANPGYGDTIDAGHHGRLFDVAQGASLTLENVTLQNGVVFAHGGAIYNQGTLVLSQVLVQNNTAQICGAGGGVWSNGLLTVMNSTIDANLAENQCNGPAFGGGIYIAGGTANITGSAFGNPNGYWGNTAEGQTAYGGAVYIASGNVTMSGDTFGTLNRQIGQHGNSALGGVGNLGEGYGGAVCVAGGSVFLTNDYIQGNVAYDLQNTDGFYYGYRGGYGGGVYISRGATVYIDSFTVAQTYNNLSWSNIYGPYTLFTYPVLQVTGLPSSSTAGASDSFTVTALASANKTLTTYTGTVHFTSSDPQAVLPADYTFTSADQGVHTFTVDLKTAGSQTITATDTATGSIVGSEGITVNPAATSSLALSGFPSTTTAGAAGNFTVTAHDPYGNIATSYLGTVHFTSSDANATLPADYTFTARDAGTHTFSATLKTAGTQIISALDTVLASLSASETGIAVTPAVAIHFAIAAPATVTAGSSFSITVTALDFYGNVVTGYQGTIRIASTNGRGNLPSTYTFKAADNGVHVFAGVALHKIAQHTITITDSMVNIIQGSVIVDVV